MSKTLILALTIFLSAGVFTVGGTGLKGPGAPVTREAAISDTARETVVVSDTDPLFDPDDMTPYFTALLSGGRSGLKIVLPRGVYHFRPERGLGKYHAATNHDNGYRYFAFPLRNCTDIEIDGGGSEFIFHGRMIPFLVENSTGVTLRNFTVDWEVPFTLEARVLASTASTLDIEIPDGFGYALENGKLIMRGEGWEDRCLGENIVFDPATGGVAYRTDDHYIPKPDNFDVRAVDLGVGRLRLSTRFAVSPPPTGTIITFKGVFGDNRHSPAIHLNSSADVLIEDVTVHHCGGMALVAERTRDVTVRRFDVVLREGSGRTITSTADATHFCNCAGTVLIEDCTFRNMLDDATNVHGTYVRIVEREDERTVIARINHPQQAGFTFAGEGDELNIVDGETLLPLSSVRVADVEPLNRHYIRLRLDGPGDEALIPGNGLENMTWYPELIFRNNRVINNRARSILVSTPRRVLIEGNTFSSMMAAILLEGDMDHWYESGAVRDVTIRGNLFLDGTYGGADFPTIFINPHQKREVTGVAYEKNIVIEDNIFRTFNEQILRARSVKGLIFRGNRIEHSTTYRPWNDLPTIGLTNCHDVVIEDNEYLKPGEMTVVRE